MPDASLGSLGITWCFLESPLEVSSGRFRLARLLGSQDHGDDPAERGRTATDGWGPSRWGQSPGNGGGYCDASPPSTLAPGDRAWALPASPSSGAPASQHCCLEKAATRTKASPLWGRDGNTWN
uniref:Uncharacterized protein n=1 Tax=Pan paniscus TaxID=9597 RepID=A0A2R9B9A0_PANPA